MKNTEFRTGAIILSGGAGTRLDGLDKGLQIYHGKPLIERVIEIIEPQVDEIHICANRNIDTYLSFGHQVHKDQHASYEGPMSGISSALKASVHASALDQVLISSCDTPYLPSNLREKLEFALHNNGIHTDVAIVHDGDRRQNLHCLIQRSAWQSLINFFDQGGRAMHRWFSTVNVIDVDFKSRDTCFLNINHPEQLNTPPR